MKRILVLSQPEDRSGRALALGGALADRFDADIDVLRVLEESHGSGGLEAKTHDGSSIRDVLMAAEKASLESEVEALRSDTREVHLEVEWGVPWEAVISRVEAREIGLVVKPAGGLSQSGSVFFGSTALHLFRRCPCPVWVVGESAHLPERIVAAIDPTADPHRRRLAERVLRWADEVADLTDSAVEIASAWSTPDFERVAEYLGDEDRERLRDQALDAAEADLANLLIARGVSVDKSSLHLLEGRPTEVLPALASQKQAELIVMGTLSRPDRTGDLLGATAETVVRQVRCSVLTVPPTATLSF